MKGFSQTVLAPLLPVLQRERALMRQLESHRVSPEQFLVYVYDRELSKQRTVGIVITIILAGIFASFGLSASVSLSESIGFGVAGALLGLGIGLGAMRLMQGKSSRYYEYPDNLAGGFTALGVLHAWNAKKVSQWNESQWQSVRAHRPDLSKKRYLRFPIGPKTEEERQQLRRMTPRKQRVVHVLKRLQFYGMWSWTLCVPLAFLDGTLAGIWGFNVLFFWFFLETIIGFISRETGAFAASETVVVYGWPARLITGLVFLPALLLVTATTVGFVRGLLAVLATGQLTVF